MTFQPLAEAIRGDVVLPGNARYDDLRRGWNLITEARPGAIAIPVDADDIAAAVRFAADHDLPVAVRATGHGPGNPNDGALTISTRHLTDVTIDAATGAARIAPGATARAIMEAALPLGYAPSVGTSGTVGIGGYISGGGLPVLGRSVGFAADRVTAIDLVLADGSQVRATAETHPDLFFAARGGKGNVGVITAIETRLHPITSLYGGVLTWPIARLPEVLTTWVSWTSTLPREMNDSLTINIYPDAPMVPEPLRGQTHVSLRVAWLGTADDGASLLEPFRALQPVSDTLRTMSMPDIWTITGTPEMAIPVRDRGILFDTIDAGWVDTIIALVGEGAILPPGFVEIRHLGGALAETLENRPAIGHRQAPYGLNMAFIAMPGTITDIDALQFAIFDRLAPWHSGATWPCFLGSGDASPDRVRTAYTADDFARLRRIKAEVDPTNRFRVNHTITPAS